MFDCIISITKFEVVFDLMNLSHREGCLNIYIMKIIFVCVSVFIVELLKFYGPHHKDYADCYGMLLLHSHCVVLCTSVLLCLVGQLSLSFFCSICIMFSTGSQCLRGFS